MADSRIEKIIELVENSTDTILVDIADIDSMDKCRVLNIVENDENEKVGLYISYEEDGGGYGNIETFEEIITWEELLGQDFQFYKEIRTRQEIEI